MRKKRKRTSTASAVLADIAGPLTLRGHLKAIRLGEEMSQTEFAESLGISKQHLSDVERGQKVVSVERANGWGETLGYSPKQFVRLALQDQLDRAGLEYDVAP